MTSRSGKRNPVHFVKAGKKPPKSITNPTGILHLASDWELVPDLGYNYVFPFHIALTDLRPDILIFSKSLSPCEENMGT